MDLKAAAGWISIWPPPKPMAPEEKPVSLRLPQTVLDRADKVVPALERSAMFALLGKTATRSDVLRVALLHGLSRLEESPVDVLNQEMGKLAERPSRKR